MQNRESYIRYRIYVQRARKADRNYPRRLCKNLMNLHINIEGDQQFWESGLRSYNIISKTFIPHDLNHVNPKYYQLIANLSTYFNCYAVWRTTMIKGTIKSINTFTIYGQWTDAKLAYHYITKIIDNLNDMRWNLKKEYRRLKINQRRRGENTRDKDNASVKASKFLYGSLDNIIITTKDILDARRNNPKTGEKLLTIENYIRNRGDIDFRAYNYKGRPKIENAYSRIDKFQNKRIIR